MANVLAGGRGNRVRMVGEDSSRTTRQCGSIKVNFQKTKAAQRSIMYNRIKMYNQVP